MTLSQATVRNPHTYPNMDEDQTFGRGPFATICNELACIGFHVFSYFMMFYTQFVYMYILYLKLFVENRRRIEGSSVYKSLRTA